MLRIFNRKLKPEEIERGAGALVPFVQRWNMQVNPEELGEMAWAVLKHARSKAPWQEVDADVNAQIDEFERGQKEMYEAWDRSNAERAAASPGAAGS